MKVIDLLNRIANNEPVPKAIRCFLYEGDNDVFIYLENEQEYYNGYGYMRFPNHHLNDEVEIVGNDTANIFGNIELPQKRGSKKRTRRIK